MKTPDTITCPSCGSEIPLTEAISHQVAERMRLEFEEAQRAREAAHAEALAQKDSEAEANLSKLRAELEAKAEARAKETAAHELSDLNTQLQSKTQQLDEARSNELALRNERRKLQEEREAFDLEAARKLDEDREALVAAASEHAEEKYRLQLREQKTQMEHMTRHIEELSATADQKRSGLQGDVGERELEDLLREFCRDDEITAVKKGKNGADLHQRIRTPRGLDCGLLLWESKNAKDWTDRWVTKLKADQQAVKADEAVIVSSVLPNGVRRMGRYGDVWVCDFATAPILALVLRRARLQIGQALVVQANRAHALDALYEYLCGKDFQLHLTNLVDAVMTMKTELDSEKLVAGRMWAKRETQLTLIMQDSAGIYGDLEAILGDALQPVSALELPSGGEERDESLAIAG